jgi:hypothetical protein
MINMKNKIKLFLVGLVAFSITGCEMDPYNVEFSENTDFVQLGQTSGSIEENAGSVISTTIQLGQPNESGVTVAFTVSSDDDSRYELLTPSPISIPAGSTSAEIQIEPIDNFDVDGNIDVTIELNESGTSSPIGIAGFGLERTSRVITIIDNDCPITIEDWVGTYDVSENFTDGGNAPNGLSDFFSETYQVELSLAPGDITGTKVVITNSEGFDVYINDGTVMSFDTCNGAIIFDDGNPLLALWNVFPYTDSTYDEEALSLQCSGEFIAGTSNFGPYQFTFTKQ